MSITFQENYRSIYRFEIEKLFSRMLNTNNKIIKLA